MRFEVNNKQDLDAMARRVDELIAETQRLVARPTKTLAATSPVNNTTNNRSTSMNTTNSTMSEAEIKGHLALLTDDALTSYARGAHDPLIVYLIGEEQARRHSGAPMDEEGAKAKATLEWDYDPAVRRGFTAKQNYVNARAMELTGRFHYYGGSSAVRTFTAEDSKAGR